MRHALLTGLCLLSSLSCQAGRPLTTEDAAPLEQGACELESFLGRGHAADSSATRAQSVQVGCGIGLDTQVALQLQHERADASTRFRSLVGKTRLVDGGEHDPSWALSWGLQQQREPGQSWQQDEQLVNGVISWPLGDELTLHGNLGWTRSRLTKQQSTTWALALEKAVTPAWDAAIETFGNDREASPWVQVGVRWAVVAERFWLDSSWGQQFGAERQRQLTLGLRWAF